jgi:uncharacterized DUF497 family protein
VSRPGLHFEWDQTKAASNARKHGVTFTEAASAFYDPHQASYHDEAHSDEGEERFILIGISNRLRFIAVVHADHGDFIRIISARKATKTEQKLHGTHER